MKAALSVRVIALSLAVAVCVLSSACSKNGNEQQPTVTTTAVITTTSSTTSPSTSTTTQTTSTVTNNSGSNTQDLDPTYQRLLLVNAKNPLPEDYDYGGNLTEVPKKYINGSLNQVDKEIYPYLKAMLDAAWADKVKLYVRSPYRSYSTQKYLFNQKVEKVIKAGTPKDQAEAVAAAAVARPGTSEHHTGLAIDFNVASSEFTNSAMHKWLMENAENYGFILRYPEDKTDITEIMYESWHWRFVGINTAKEMNRLGVTLEEYVAMKAQP